VEAPLEIEDDLSLELEDVDMDGFLKDEKPATAARATAPAAAAADELELAFGDGDLDDFLGELDGLDEPRPEAGSGPAAPPQRRAGPADIGLGASELEQLGSTDDVETVMEMGADATIAFSDEDLQLYVEDGSGAVDDKVEDVLQGRPKGAGASDTPGLTDSMSIDLTDSELEDLFAELDELDEDEA
jgi:hypothetical protein